MSKASSRPLALLVFGGSEPPKRLRGLLNDDRVRVIRRRELSKLSPWPSTPLVLLACDPPRGKGCDVLARARKRGRNDGWFAVCDESAREQSDSAWGEMIDGSLTGQLTPTTLEALAQARVESNQHRRSSTELGRSTRLLENKLSVMTDTLHAAGSLLDPRMVSQFIMERAAAIVGATRWRLYRVDAGESVLNLETHNESPLETSPAASLGYDRGLAGLTASSRQLIVVADPKKDDRIDRELEWNGPLPRAILSLPLISRGRVIGVIELADPPHKRFRSRDIELVATFAEPAAIALDNSQLFRKLEERTVTDDLTGLYNARFMDNYLRREVTRGIRYGHNVALLFIDLDGFKQVNDVHGHMAGSRTLVEVGEILRDNVREIDVVARWGGDEFAVVLPDTKGDGALVMAERLRDRLAEHQYLADKGLDVRISASIGVAAFPDQGRSSSALLAAADRAMYDVKESGKNGAKMGELAEEPSLVSV